MSEGIVSENLLRAYYAQSGVLRLKLKYVVKSILSKVREGKKKRAFLFKGG